MVKPLSISAKSSRKIVVETTSYVWAVSEDSGYSVLVVQVATGKGQKLEVTVNWSNPQMGVSDAHHGPVPITPRMVAKNINAALNLGWQPQSLDKKAFRCRRKGNDKLEQI